MSARRWGVALSTLAATGSAVMVFGLPAGSAAGAPDLGRIEVGARGDAMYFEVNSGSIPASPSNNASSLYAESRLTSTGGATATASTPFFGSTVQNLPGTANGVPPQFGLKDVGFPFTRLPGFITCRDSGEENTQLAFGRVNAKCGQESSEAHGAQGAPPGAPAPNQQETADTVTKIAEDGASVAEATGTVRGIVVGPLQVGNAVTTAQIRDAGHQPTITSSTSGTFSVNGQQFGFTEKGITFAGQGSQQDALKQADDALKAAGIRIEVAPVTKSFDDVSGRTSYTIGGLKVTWAQPGSELVYILCRVSLTSVNETSAPAPALGTAPAGDAGPVESPSTNPAQSRPAVSDAASAPSPADSRPPTSESPSVPAGDPPAAEPALTLPTAAEQGSAAAAPAEPAAEPGPDPEAAPEPAQAVLGPTTLGGFTGKARPPAGGGTGLYLMILVGGAVIFGGQAALSRFAANRG